MDIKRTSESPCSSPSVARTHARTGGSLTPSVCRFFRYLFPSAPLFAPRRTAKRKRVERAGEENEDDLVSLGSESEGEGDSSDDEGEEAEPGSHGDPKKTAERRAASRGHGSNGGGALGAAALVKPGPRSRSFFTSAAARGGAGAQPNRKPGK